MVIYNTVSLYILQRLIYIPMRCFIQGPSLAVKLFISPLCKHDDVAISTSTWLLIEDESSSHVNSM